jgi:microcystin-dependent protein
MMCQGQLLSITQFTALFSLLGTTYGGNGTSTFQLPDLRGRVAIKFGTDPAGNSYDIGQSGGVEQLGLGDNEIPPHTHIIAGAGVVTGRKSAPEANWALATSSNGDAFYATVTSTVPLNAASVSAFTGGTATHTNMQPFLAINWCIAMAGIFPARN